MNTEQTKIWNGDAGRAWVETQQLIEQMFQEIATMLVCDISAASQVLDVGCGTGSTSAAASRQLGVQGLCTGIDISQQMINVAQTAVSEQGLTTRFICGDAQRYIFAPASFDLIISRFGVMFFDDPVAAFANLKQAARRHAELRFIAWRSADENPFMTTAERVGSSLLPHMPIRKPDEPGQFAFANKERMTDILQASGWTGVNVAAIDVPCSFAEKDLLLYLSRMGPLGRVLQQEDEQTRSSVIKIVRRAFEPYVHGEQVSFNAACWKVTASAA
ncbi:SAM-dependent methyltransferase [Herminiimonas sp. KBW02]|uniref:class I SAM-dependent methyltransferase n=1 Tax=Herminiimonas sp. KBW02 TaxID=2153363 RepID=UPI000F59574A|nr:class I SAM-dependent methyltransferase [Herminiimonas sp. KBW02]RQO37162.1 SAM-dependent methyltransferase [Herminiimonas sp. KBW02]